MNLTLRRTSFGDDGIFGILQDDQNNEIAVTLEHAYPVSLKEGGYAPKIKEGVYLCVRGSHRLESMVVPFETFEVTHVDGHTNILFHAGNYNADSNGCILLGRRVVPNPDKASENMITSSKNTFNKFMDLQKGVNEFTLTVV